MSEYERLVAQEGWQAAEQAVEALSAEQEYEHLAMLYRELWVDYNATASLIENLNARLRDIKQRQRSLANKMAKVGQEGQA